MYLSTLMLFVRQTPPENLEEREAAEELGGWKNKDTSPARLIWHWSLFFICFEILSQDLTQIVQTTRCGWSLQCFLAEDNNDNEDNTSCSNKLMWASPLGDPFLPFNVFGRVQARLVGWQRKNLEPDTTCQYCHCASPASPSPSSTCQCCHWCFPSSSSSTSPPSLSLSSTCQYFHFVFRPRQ